MRVLHVFNALEFSGAETMYVQAARQFQDRGCELIALSTAEHLGSFANNFKESGYKIEHKPLKLSLVNLFGFICSLIWIYRYVKKENIDVVHIHRSSNFWWVALAAKLANAGVVRTIHNVFKNRWFTRPKAILERWTARVFLKVVFHTIGESVYQNEKTYYKNTTIRVNNWFDNRKFYPAHNAKEKDGIRAELGLSDELVVISVGGCSYVKRHEDIIDAVSIMVKTRNIVYLHLGDGVNHNNEKHYSKKINIDKSIRFIGNTDEVRKYLIASDIYLMPSRFEGLGNATLEAMACGLPSILYDVPGLKDLINEDDNGMLIKEDVYELVKAISYLADNKIACSKKGMSAMNFANANYSQNSGVSGIVSIYSSVI